MGMMISPIETKSTAQKVISITNNNGFTTKYKNITLDNENTKLSMKRLLKRGWKIQTTLRHRVKPYVVLVSMARPKGITCTVVSRKGRPRPLKLRRITLEVPYQCCRALRTKRPPNLTLGRPSMCLPGTSNVIDARPQVETNLDIVKKVQPRAHLLDDE